MCEDKLRRRQAEGRSRIPQINIANQIESSSFSSVYRVPLPRQQQRQHPNYHPSVIPCPFPRCLLVPHKSRAPSHSSSIRRRRRTGEPLFFSSFKSIPLFPSLPLSTALLLRCATTSPSSPSWASNPPEVVTMTVKAKGILPGSAPVELKEVLMAIASELGDAVDDLEALKVVPLKGAMTNEVFQINWPSRTGAGVVRKVLVRIYGEGVEIFFNRNDEVKTFECMSMHGEGPRLLGRFADGRVEEFIHARTLSAADLRDPDVSELIAAKLRGFHNLEIPGPRNSQLWGRMRSWLKEARALCSDRDANDFGLHKLEEEISLLEKALSREDEVIGFCHNDLQYGNIMMDEETRSITLIDYEYSSYNPIAYDLANHFCEMAANYHSDTPHVLDYGLYPDYEERARFALNYLASTGDKPSDTEVAQLVDDAEKYTLANHLFWGLWGLISAYVNNIDFDYKEYARQRFGQYWKRKPVVLSCTDVGRKET
ncbi:hypothetical protein MLD38_022650 [Melastoma candidum]|uniref:Uncharacterized protein n=1 Tax=Melastoma candidum TaxID=119954 RepID=A0ACB9QT53_9MYRT|nr:hypothetical protein MLD38_022650 [Melastoma candidum]